MSKKQVKNKPVKKKAVKLNTEALGKISQSKLNSLIKETGSQSALAKALEIPKSTVRSWSWRLRTLNGK